MNGLLRIRIFEKSTGDEYHAVDDCWLIEDADQLSFFTFLTRDSSGKLRILSWDRLLFRYEDVSMCL